MSKSIKISDVKIRISKDIQNIYHNPYFLSLKYNDKKIYYDYVDYKRTQNYKKSSSWCGFLDLLNSIKKHGFIYDSKSPIVIKKKHGTWISCHGRHRICILYYLYDGRCKLIIQKRKDEKYNVIGVIY